MRTSATLIFCLKALSFEPPSTAALLFPSQLLAPARTCNTYLCLCRYAFLSSPSPGSWLEREFTGHATLAVEQGATSETRAVLHSVASNLGERRSSKNSLNMCRVESSKTYICRSDVCSHDSPRTESRFASFVAGRARRGTCAAVDSGQHPRGQDILIPPHPMSA